MREKNRKTKIEFLKMAYVDNMKQSVTHVSTTEDKKKKYCKNNKILLLPTYPNFSQKQANPNPIEQNDRK